MLAVFKMMILPRSATENSNRKESRHIEKQIETSMATIKKAAQY